MDLDAITVLSFILGTAEIVALIWSITSINTLKYESQNLKYEIEMLKKNHEEEKSKRTFDEIEKQLNQLNKK